MTENLLHRLSSIWCRSIDPEDTGSGCNNLRDCDAIMDIKEFAWRNDMKSPDKIFQDAEGNMVRIIDRRAGNEIGEIKLLVEPFRWHGPSRWVDAHTVRELKNDTT